MDRRRARCTEQTHGAGAQTWKGERCPLSGPGHLRSAARVPTSVDEPRSYRVMLVLGGVVYLAWWFAVDSLLPAAFNPLASRLLVVGYFLLSGIACSVSGTLLRRAESFYYVGALGLVGHYFYLVLHNAQDGNWTIGAYVVVFALCVSVQSRRWLLAFTLFCFACGLTVWLLEPALQRTIFLPGLATVLTLCTVVLLSRLQLLERLADSTSRFESLFDATFEGVAVQHDGKIIDVNAAFVSLFGYARHELLGRSVVELNAPEYRARVAAQLRDVPTGRYESVGLRKDGSEFAIEISTKPHSYRGCSARLAAVRDVTDRKRAEQEHQTRVQEQAARASAQEAIRLRDEFISIASHELRTPIASLLLQLDVFVRSFAAARDAETLAAYAVRARRQLGRMNRLVDELLDASRMGAGKLNLERERIELDALVKEVLDSLAEDLRRAGCQAEVRATGSLAGHWDRLRLEQVVENLLRNAMTYGPGKPIEISLREVDGGRVSLAVRDHGIGIDKAMQERVFMRFERGVSGRHYGGFGLGLYITKRVVEAHHGTVRVDSEPGQGATFWVELPTQRPSECGLQELGARE
jgi:PAS domain S-box-containing protein